MPPCFPASTSLHLQRVSRTADLYTSTISSSPGPRRTSRALELYASTSARLQRASRSPYVHASTSLHYSEPPDLRTPTSLHLYRASKLPYLCTSMSLRLQRASRPPCLLVATPTAHRRTSIPPYRYTCGALRDLHTFTTSTKYTRLHDASLRIAAAMLETDMSSVEVTYDLI